MHIRFTLYALHSIQVRGNLDNFGSDDACSVSGRLEQAELVAHPAEGDNSLLQQVLPSLRHKERAVLYLYSALRHLPLPKTKRGAKADFDLRTSLEQPGQVPLVERFLWRSEAMNRFSLSGHHGTRGASDATGRTWSYRFYRY